RWEAYHPTGGASVQAELSSTLVAPVDLPGDVGSLSDRPCDLVETAGDYNGPPRIAIVNDPSGCRTTIARSNRMSYFAARPAPHPSSVISSRTWSARAMSSYPMAHRCAL